MRRHDDLVKQRVGGTTAFAQAFEPNGQPLLAGLRRSVIYGAQNLTE
jgi:hypothetical protein